MSDYKPEGLTIDWETADRITIANLKDCVITLTKEVEEFESLMEMGDLADYQSRDYTLGVSRLRAMKKVLEYFGEK